MITVTVDCRLATIIHYRKLEGELLNFVSDPKSNGTIVVAFGTIVKWANAPENKLNAMVGALSQLTDYRIIWAYNGPSLKFPAHIRAMEWIPQNDLLS